MKKTGLFPRFLQGKILVGGHKKTSSHGKTKRHVGGVFLGREGQGRGGEAVGNHV